MRSSTSSKRRKLLRAAAHPMRSRSEYSAHMIPEVAWANTAKENCRDAGLLVVVKSD